MGNRERGAMRPKYGISAVQNGIPRNCEFTVACALRFTDVRISRQQFNHQRFLDHFCFAIYGQNLTESHPLLYEDLPLRIQPAPLAFVFTATFVVVAPNIGFLLFLCVTAVADKLRGNTFLEYLHDPARSSFHDVSL